MGMMCDLQVRKTDLVAASISWSEPISCTYTIRPLIDRIHASSYPSNLIVYLDL